MCFLVFGHDLVINGDTKYSGFFRPRQYFQPGSVEGVG